MVALDLAAMADDAGILSRRATSRALKRATRVDVEAGKGAAEVLALPQDGQPAQAGLESFQRDLLEERAIVTNREPPFGIVVLDVVVAAAAPGAAAAAVRRFPQAVGDGFAVSLDHDEVPSSPAPQRRRGVPRGAADSGHRDPGPGAAIVAGIVLGLINAIVRPLLILLTLPVTLVTLGLFIFVVNAICLALAAWFVPGFTISGFIPALLGALVISVISWLLSAL